MGNTCELNLITSTGEIIKEEIISFITESSNGKIEILPNHIEIIISTIPTKFKNKNEFKTVRRKNKYKYR